MEDHIPELQHHDRGYETEETELSESTRRYDDADSSSCRSGSLTEETSGNDMAKEKRETSKRKTPKLSMVPENTSTDRHKTSWLIIAGILAIFAGGIMTGMLVCKDGFSKHGRTSENSAPTTFPSPTNTAAPPPLTPTTLRSHVERVLVDEYEVEPLDESIVTWLTETSSWRPSEGDPDNANYLWFERYAMVSLYHATNGHNWTHNDNWLHPDLAVCSWFSRVPNACPGPMTNLVLCK